jgi:alkylhydroperoxidase/carboxymuconolactone decarboxylase family protein YurZ
MAVYKAQVLDNEPTEPIIWESQSELCFGDFATRTGLDGETRELLTVVLLASLDGAKVQVRSHVCGALKVGNTPEEVVCALVHASGYMGISRLFNVCRELLAQESDAGKVHTQKERSRSASLFYFSRLASIRTHSGR